MKDTKGEPIIGATVMIKGTSNGTITDFDSNFTLDVAQGEEIEISYIGYKTQIVKPGNRTVLSITLLEDAKYWKRLWLSVMVNNQKSYLQHLLVP